MSDDIVTRLRGEAIKETDDGICYSCGGNFQTVIHYPGCVILTVSEAADEIERLREQLEFAHNILGSETMIWVFHGSENWQQSNIDHLRDPIHAYWEKYGNSFREARRG